MDWIFDFIENHFGKLFVVYVLGIVIFFIGIVIIGVHFLAKIW